MMHERCRRSGLVGGLALLWLAAWGCDSDDGGTTTPTAVDAGAGGGAADAGVDAPPDANTGGDGGGGAGPTGDYLPLADPSFSAASLPASAQLWRARLLAAIDNPAQSPNADTDAATPTGDT